MRSKKEREVLEAAREFRVRVEKWRQNRNGQPRMPKGLWEESVKAAKRYGVSSVAADVSLGVTVRNTLYGKASGNLIRFEKLVSV